MRDMSFAAQSRRLFAKIYGAYMKTFRLTVLQLTRIEVEIKAESEAKAKEIWTEGKILTSKIIQTDIIDAHRIEA